MDAGAGAYLREIEARFVALVGRGFSLSARDVGRVLKWHADGVPLRIVLSTLEEAARRREVEGGVRVMTLGQLERSVATAMRRRAERMVGGVAGEPRAEGPAAGVVVLAEAPSAVGAPEGGAWAKLRGALEAAGRACAGPERAALRQAWASLQRAEAEGCDPWEVAVEVDEALAGQLEALLGAEDRAKIEVLVRRRLAGEGARMSAGARAEREAFLRGRFLRDQFGVPELLAVLLA